MPRINVTTDYGSVVASIEAPPSDALERDWRFHAVARNVPGWLAHAVSEAEALERRWPFTGGGPASEPGESRNA